MASRNFNRHQSLEKEVKNIYLDVAIGASGAPTLTKGLGVASIARTAAGEYDITLDDKYVRLMHASMVHEAAAGEDLTMQIESEDVSGTKVVKIFTNTGGGYSADPSNGARLFIKLELKNSSSGE